MSYIFGGDTPQTYDAVQERRRIARQLLARSARRPQTWSDGLASSVAAFAASRNNRRADRGEERLQAEFDAQMQALFGGTAGGAFGGTGGASGGVTPSSRSYAPSGPQGRNTAGVANVAGGSGAPTAGLPFMLPDGDPDASDPRRSQFATAAPRVDDPNVYTTEMRGRLQGVDPAIVDIVGNSVDQAYGPGSTVNVTSGLRPNSRGSQHSAGQALDFGVTDADGATSNYSDPRIFDAARVAVSDGASGIGIGPNYMGGRLFHFDTGRGGGNGAPNFGNAVRTWSDWNTGNNLRRHGRQAQGPEGAGDPSFGFQAELQGIRSDRRVVPEGQAPVSVAGRAPPLDVTASAQNDPTVSQGGASGDPMRRIMAIGNLMGNPMASRGQQMVLQALLQQEMAGMQSPDPMDALRQRRMELEIAQMEQDITGAAPVDPFGPDAGVRSSEILPNGVTIQSTDYGVRVFGADGQPLQGEAAQTAISEAQQFGVDLQRSIYGNRRAGTLESDIALGGQAASAEAAGSALGSASVAAGVEAWGESRALLSTIGTYDEAISAIDNGAEAGLVYNRLPRVSLEGATLQNSMNRLGLDVVGATTFGALSEGELRLAMETAVPRGLGAPELREWLSRRRVALEKSAAMLESAAAYLTTPGNDLNGWIEQNRQQQAPQAPQPPAPAAASSQTPAYQDMQSFISDPGVIAAATEAGTTPQRMWEVLQAQRANQ